MHIIWTIIIGFLAGVVAKFIHPGKEGMGFIMTTLLGIGGSVFATFIGQALGLYQAGSAAGFIGAVIGAILLLVIYGAIKGRAP
jgi:uncharacterized membrane protein YeaQ/YmgE (transglycosylase-associated protein family)